MTWTRLKCGVLLAALAGMLELQSVSSFAQVSSAQIAGVITDSSGAFIPNVSVLISSQDTGMSRTVTTNQTGEFVAPALEPGVYRITVEVPGFQTLVAEGLKLAVGDKQNYHFSLKVGQAEQSVTVTSEGELINTTNAEISSVVNETAIKELPLNGRDPSSLVFLTTGVSNVLNTSAGVIQAGTSIPTETGASAGGGRQGSTYYLLDGVPNVDTYELLAAPFPNADATQEFRVTSNNYDAEYGFAPGAIVSIQTKSGTNSFHGVVFEFLRNNDLNAGDYFTHLVDPLKRNQFGGGIGGPVLKNKLFFFANYEGTRASTGSSSNVQFTPTAAMLAGDFSAVPVALGAPFATIDGKPNQVDPSLYSHGALALAQNLPLGQVPATGQVNVVLPTSTYSYNEDTERLDYSISSSQRATLRSFDLDYTQPTKATPGNFLAFVDGATGRYFNELLSHTWTISPTLVNVFSGFWTRLDGGAGGPVKTKDGSNFCLSQVIDVASPANHCILIAQNVANGFGTAYASPYTYHRTTWGPSDTISKTMGRHLISAGINAYHQMAHEVSTWPVDPVISFNGSVTGFGLADFLLGDVATFYQGGGEVNSQEGWQIGIFAQDQFRVRPSLTVTAGLRWEPTLPPTIAGGHAASFIPGAQSRRYPNAPLGLVFIGDPGVEPGLMTSDYRIFDPRVGIAWQPKALPHTAIRAGFGMFIAPLQYSTYNHMGDMSPFSPTFSLNRSPSDPISYDHPWANYAPTGGQDPFPPFASASNNPPASVTFPTSLGVQTVINRNFRLGTTQSWNASVEQVLPWNMALELAYVGSESYALSTPLDLNPGIYAEDGNRTRYPAFSNLYSLQSIGTSSYHSFQNSLTKHSSHGLQFQTNFTWSKTIDTSSVGSLAWVTGIGDPFDLKHNRGASDLNIPFISVSNLTYETPGLKGSNAVMRNVLGTWEISLIYTSESGRPFSIVGGNGNDNSESLQYGDRADVTGQAYGEREGGKSKWLNRYFNTDAFKTNAPGTFGDSGRNLFQAPPTNTADLGIFKNWTIRERYGFQFRWEMFNALNHASFNIPNNDPSSPTFGQITSIGPIAPRVMQGALKLSF